MLKVTCPQCQMLQQIAEADLGFSVICQQCQAPFVPQPGGSAPGDRRRIICPACQGPMLVLAADLGYDVECPLCQHQFVAWSSEPQKQQLPRRSSRRERPERPDPPERSSTRPWRQSRVRDEDEDTVVVNCPDCGNDVEVEGADLGYRVECPHCQGIFRARDPDSPRRNSTYESRMRKHYEPELAREAIRRPALAMIWSGWIIGLLYLLIGVGLIIGAIIRSDDPGVAAREQTILMSVYGGCVTLILLPMAIIFAVGGHQTLKLKGTAWAYTSAIFGIVHFMFFTISPTSWVTLGLGIWMLIAVNRSDVQHLMRSRQRNYSEEERDD
jgi:uncharacterized CHY-type Zn-finger protein